jgi:hypothetical protein
MAARKLFSRERGALVRLDVWAQASSRERGRHDVEIVVERTRVDDERGSRQLGGTRHRARAWHA